MKTNYSVKLWFADSAVQATEAGSNLHRAMVLTWTKGLAEWCFCCLRRSEILCALSRPYLHFWLPGF